MYRFKNASSYWYGADSWPRSISPYDVTGPQWDKRRMFFCSKWQTVAYVTSKYMQDSTITPSLNTKHMICGKLNSSWYGSLRALYNVGYVYCRRWKHLWHNPRCTQPHCDWNKMATGLQTIFSDVFCGWKSLYFDFFLSFFLRAQLITSQH